MLLAVSVLERIKRTGWCMASVAASSTNMRPHSSVSYVESPDSGPAGTNDIECRVTGFPAGFGGWTAAKMYEWNFSSNHNNNNQRSASESENAARAARQEVGLSHGYNRQSLISNSRDMNVT